MTPTNTCLVIIPTFNELENIPIVIDRLLEEAPFVDILVVDDNSPDKTAQAVEEICASEPRVHLLNRTQKEGLALAYRAGFDWGLSKGYQCFIQMDADLSHDPSDTHKIQQALLKHDVVVGSRYISGGGTSGWGLHRQVISRGGNTYARMILGGQCQDMTGGFNGWSKHALETIDYKTVVSKGYAYQVEMKFRALKAGFIPFEFPIHFRNRTLGKSKMSYDIVFEAAYRVLKLKFR